MFSPGYIKKEKLIFQNADGDDGRGPRLIHSLVTGKLPAAEPSALPSPAVKDKSSCVQQRLTEQLPCASHPRPQGRMNKLKSPSWKVFHSTGGTQTIQ